MRSSPCWKSPARQPYRPTPRRAAHNYVARIIATEASGRIARSAALLKGMVSTALRFGLAFMSRSRHGLATGIGASGARKRRQAVMTMNCEFELLLGRPYDLPGCAANADP